MPDEITSRRNAIIREMVKISRSASYRREKNLFLAEGARLCSDAAKSGLRIPVLLDTEKASQKYAGYLSAIRPSAESEYRVSSSVASLLSDTKTNQGIFCLCFLPDPPASFPSPESGKHCLVLENIQDPANLGAVLRTAEALGFGSVLLTGQCCDAFSRKALRASMGAVFRLPFFTFPDSSGTVRRLNENGFSTFAAVPDRNALPVTELCFDRPSAAVVGNEGSGLLPETERACLRRITIPMGGRAESLNAAAASAILMWEMTRGNGKKESSARKGKA